MKTTAAKRLDPHPSPAANLPPPDPNAHPALADADTRRRVHYLRLIAAAAGPRARLAAAELRILENERRAGE